jgi:hypothetical protein
MAAGCASSGDSERPPRPSVKAGEFGTPGCFLRQSVQNFEVLDDRNLIVFAPRKTDAYHVQVSPSSGELRFTHTLAFESQGSSVCGYGRDGLIVAETGTGPRRLSITSVYRLDAAALDGLRVRFGKQTVPGATTPKAGEGAEIERGLDPEQAP